MLYFCQVYIFYERVNIKTKDFLKHRAIPKSSACYQNEIHLTYI